MGWGFLSLVALSWALDESLLPSNFAAADLETPQSILVLVFSIIVSNLLGNIALIIGEYSTSRRFPPKKRIELACRVSEKNYDLLKQSFLDAQLKFESSCAFRGTMLFGVLALVIKLVTTWTDISPEIDRSNATVASLVGALVAIIIMEGSRAAALRDLQAIEETLDQMDSRLT